MINRTGWGRNIYSQSEEIDFNFFEIREKIELIKTGLGVGLGRSYGDSGLNSGGSVITSRPLKKIKLINSDGLVYCESGITIGELERFGIKHNLFPPTVPGTEFVTIGGAVASDVHGKNHHKSGSFANSVEKITLLNFKGELIELYAAGPTSDLFWATVGGMGLTGFIVSVELKLNKITSSLVLVENKKVKSLSNLLTLNKLMDTDFEYTVSWIDLSGNFNGRGIVSGGNHADFANVPKNLQKKAQRTTFPKNIKLPNFFPTNLVTPLTVKLFNEFWFNKPINNGYQDIRSFLHPLDSVSNWNLIYGKNGFIQYQFQIPIGEEEYLEKLLGKLKKLNFGSFLGVLKRFGTKNKGLLSFPDYGWTLAIDFPAKLPGLYKFLNLIDEELCNINGKVYLTKDSRLQKNIFQIMYPQYNKWKQIKNQIDPNNFWQSDQGKRLDLC